MATTAEGRRRRGKGKAEKTKHRRTTVHDLPDHIFEQILLRLGPYSACSLVRAAATCRRWCRVVADAGFLAQLGPAPHLGDYCTVGNCLYVFVPSSPETPFDNRRLSLDFLPDWKSWKLANSHGSLLLLSKKDQYSKISNLIVCEPLTGRYQGILWSGGRDAFLLDGGRGADRRTSMSNFRVITPFTETKARVFYAGRDGGWRAVCSLDTGGFPEGTLKYGNFVGRANCSLYWRIDGNSRALFVLDETTMEFSVTVFPESVWEQFDKQTFRVIGGEDGVLRVVYVRLIGKTLKVFARLLPGGGDGGWVLEKELSLPEATMGLPWRQEFFFNETRIVAANDRYILLTPCTNTWVFSVELDTMRVEREHERNKYAGTAYPYFLPWPPMLPGHVSEKRP